jgi:hypothetical protein
VEERGDYHVIMAVRDVAKAERVAAEQGFAKDSYSIMVGTPNVTRYVIQCVSNPCFFGIGIYLL